VKYNACFIFIFIICHVTASAMEIPRAFSPNSPVGKVLAMEPAIEGSDGYSTVIEFQRQSKQKALNSLMSAIGMHDNTTAEQIIWVGAGQVQRFTAEELISPQPAQKESALLFALKKAQSKQFPAQMCAFLLFKPIGPAASETHIQSSAPAASRDKYLQLLATYVRESNNR